MPATLIKPVAVAGRSNSPRSEFPSPQSALHALIGRERCCAATRTALCRGRFRDAASPESCQCRRADLGIRAELRAGHRRSRVRAFSIWRAEIFRFSPMEPRALITLGQVELMAGNFDDAAAGTFRQAAALASGDWKPVLLLEDSLVEAGKPNEAASSENSNPRNRGRLAHPWINSGAGYVLTCPSASDDAAIEDVCKRTARRAMNEPRLAVGQDHERRAAGRDRRYAGAASTHAGPGRAPPDP